MVDNSHSGAEASEEPLNVVALEAASNVKVKVVLSNRINTMTTVVVAAADEVVAAGTTGISRSGTVTLLSPFALTGLCERRSTSAVFPS